MPRYGIGRLGSREVFFGEAIAPETPATVTICAPSTGISGGCAGGAGSLSFSSRWPVLPPSFFSFVGLGLRPDPRGICFLRKNRSQKQEQARENRKIYFAGVCATANAVRISLKPEDLDPLSPFVCSL